MPTTTTRQYLTPPDVARRFGVSVNKVHRWIDAGELGAIDISTARGARPRYAIYVEDVEAFEMRRRVETTKPKKQQATGREVRHGE